MVHGPFLRQFSAASACSRSRDDVLDVLDADRQPDHVGTRAGALSLIVLKLAMRRRCRMNNEAPRIADVGEKTEKLQARNELHARFISALAVQT